MSYRTVYKSETRRDRSARAGVRLVDGGSQRGVGVGNAGAGLQAAAVSVGTWSWGWRLSPLVCSMAARPLRLIYYLSFDGPALPVIWGAACFNYVCSLPRSVVSRVCNSSSPSPHSPAKNCPEQKRKCHAVPGLRNIEQPFALPFPLLCRPTRSCLLMSFLLPPNFSFGILTENGGLLGKGCMAGR